VETPSPLPLVDSAARAYLAALDALSAKLGPQWSAVDWTDRPLQWRFFKVDGVESADQGWKIHVSAAALEAPYMLETLADVLARLHIPFKVVRRIEDVVFLNSGDAGREQLGKIVTIYPADESRALRALRELDLAWPASAGPEVQTDLHVRPGSPVSFRFGAFRASTEVVTSTGMHEFALRWPDGSLRPDTRALGDAMLALQPDPPLPGYPPTCDRIKLNEPTHLAEAEYLPLVCLGDTPRATTFLGVDLATLDTVVMKAGRRGAAGDASGTDVRDLLRGEFHALRTLLRQPDLAPHPLAFVDEEWPVLVMQDFRGERISELPRPARLEALPMLAEAVARVHDAGLVHGDIKLENAVRRESGVGLIDFELTACIGEPIRPAGTRGHLPPEVPVGRLAPATLARDIYALGGCVVHAVLDAPLGLMPAGTGRLQALLSNEGFGDVARVAKRLLAADPAQRPSAREAVAELRTAAPQWNTPIRHTLTGTCASELRWCRRASWQAAAAANAFAQQRDNGTSWRNEHFMRSFECEGINLGAAGIMLGLLSIDCALRRTDHYASVDGSARWLASRPVAGKAAGAFTGNAGVALALGVVGVRSQNDAYIAAARARLEAAAADRRELDLFSGTAGVIWVACMLSTILRENWPLAVVRNCVAHLSSLATNVDGVPVWATEPDGGAALFGCAHGSAGVAMALAQWAQATGDNSSADVARTTFRSIACHARTADGSALRMGAHEVRHHAVGNWCHGVAGYLWAILNGLGDDPELREEIDWAVGVLEAATSVGTPTYCHGLAGQLELWHLLEKLPRWSTLAQAKSATVARALRILHVKVEGRAAWTSDDPDVVTPDLWIGFLGPASALAMHAGGVRDALLSPAWLATCARL